MEDVEGRRCGTSLDKDSHVLPSMLPSHGARGGGVHFLAYFDLASSNTYTRMDMTVQRINFTSFAMLERQEIGIFGASPLRIAAVSSLPMPN
jgi:hypothetical protein